MASGVQLSLKIGPVPVAAPREVGKTLGSGQAEVGEDDSALGVEHQVPGLDVSVENSFLMSM